MQNILFWVKSHVKDLGLFLLIMICLGLIGYNFYHDGEEDKDRDDVSMVAINNDEEKEEQEEKIEAKLNVDIKGAVKTPGVYVVDNGAIINDVIKLAGGFNSNAYKNGINLSKKVTDEMVIYVYTKTEIKDKEEKEDAKDAALSSCEAPTYDICDCVSDKESVIETKPNNNNNVTEDNSTTKEEDKTDSSDSNSPININTATKAELTSIKGIGESKADAIIDYRAKSGPFKSVTDLLNVNGIGEALLAKIKEFITV